MHGDQILTRHGIIVRRANGSLVWRKEVARRDDFRGEPDESDTAGAEFGDYGDDFADDFADDMEGDDDGDDDDDDDDDFAGDFADDLADELGAAGGRRLTRRQRRALRQATKRAMGKNKGGGKRRGGSPVGKEWARTIVTGTATLAAAGTAAINIRLQTNFRGFDITFNGSLAGSTITSVFFADRLIWSSPDGVDVSTFAVTGFLRGLVKGQHIGKGTDIIINCVLPGAGSVKATVVGFKPVSYKSC